MAKKTAAEPELPDDPNRRYIATLDDKAKAKKWFDRARELGDKRQFDYAVEYYVNGMEFWPDAVEEACKPLHGCAVARKQFGGKKPGFKDTLKRSMTDKVPKQAFINSLWLFGHEPDNLNYIEGVLKSACRLHAEEAAKWAAGVFFKAIESSPKPTGKQYQSLISSLEELGDRAVERGETAFAVSAFESAVEALNAWRRRNTKDNTDLLLRDLSTKLTITKGKYRDGDSFRESIADQEGQRDLHDKQTAMQSEERFAQLIAKAQKDYDDAPDDQRTLNALVELLTRREEEEFETRAIGVLVNQFKRTGEYRHKQAADDVRMKQLARRVRTASKSGDEEAIRAAQIASLKYDLAVYKERVERYPTDNRIKFEYGVRLFRAGRYDDAIPIFQMARSDPRNRSACSMYLGRCFYKKSYYTQAIAALQEELSTYQLTDDDLAKSMLYWLARSQEAAGDLSAARETYGKILQIDYNYLDVRAKLDQLPAD